MTTTSALTPVQTTDRLQVVDVLRGIALLGILFVNMELFTHPAQQIVLPLDTSLPWLDQAAFWLVRFLGEGKFYSLFSFLFGMGLFLQMTRVEGRGGNFVPLYLKRLLVLLGIGLVHAFLFWVGDILIMYALFGAMLLFFRKARPRTLLIWIGILFVVPILVNLALTGLVSLSYTTPEGTAQMNTMLAEMKAGYEADMARAYTVYATGSFLQVTAQRAYDMQFIWVSGLFALGPGIFMMFLTGVYFGKRGLLHNLEAHAPLFRKLLVVGLVVGLVGNAAYATLSLPLARYDLSFPLFLAQLGYSFGVPALCLAYISIVALLWLQPAWRSRLKVLVPVGQMALTNYLTQSLVCTLLFYGYGLGLFGQVGTALGLGLAVGLYVLQIIFSNYWMQRFNYGPAEWLWRSLTYGKPQSMRRQQLVSATA